MELYFRDSNKFKELPFHGKKKHPVRYKFVSLDISIKNQNKLKERIEKDLDISIRVKRENGRAIFMTSKSSNDKARKWFFENYDTLIPEYGIKDFELDVDRSTVQ